MTCNMISNKAEGLAFKPGHHEEGEHVSLGTRYQIRKHIEMKGKGIYSSFHIQHIREGENLQSPELDECLGVV